MTITDGRATRDQWQQMLASVRWHADEYVGLSEQMPPQYRPGRAAMEHARQAHREMEAAGVISMSERAALWRHKENEARKDRQPEQLSLLEGIA